MHVTSNFLSLLYLLLDLWPYSSIRHDQLALQIERVSHLDYQHPMMGCFR